MLKPRALRKALQRAVGFSPTTLSTFQATDCSSFLAPNAKATSAPLTRPPRRGVNLIQPSTS
ncbi:hypothetical protein EVA_10780 [gut metagenome]|uniref:Uncharacterized protein n=1 Tax=gut metagenome TaxID=749906 RepID=J9CLZ9_9ZZZZ